jgi:hypothetical protein
VIRFTADRSNPVFDPHLRETSDPMELLHD